jgi:hypothetical protein
MNAVLPVIGVVMVALITGGASWLVAKRTASGTTATSQAGELWGASEAIRKAGEDIRAEMRSDMIAMREDNAKMRERIAALEAVVTQLREELRGR